MPPIYYQRFAVTGAANVETLDTGLESTTGFPKRIVSVIISVSGYADNIITGWVEEEQILTLPDYEVDTWADSGGTNTMHSTKKFIEIPIDRILDVGQRFKIGIECGGTAKNIRGAYKYERVT